MIPELLFSDFLAMRIEAKHVKKNSQLSIKRFRAKLERWYNIGYDLEVILTHAIEVQWRGLWIPKGMEPKQKHLKPGPLFDTIKPLVDKTRISPETDAEKQLKAQEARRQALELVRKGV